VRALGDFQRPQHRADPRARSSSQPITYQETIMSIHPDLQRQLAQDRRHRLTRAADQSRLRRDVLAERRHRRRTG
jgi:hypothetical protein